METNVMWQLLDFLVYSTVDSNVFEINDRFLRVLSFLHWSIQGKKAPINVKKAFEKVLYRCSRCQRSYFDRGTMQEAALCPKCSDWKNTYVSATEMSFSYKNVPFNCFESIKCVVLLNWSQFWSSTSVHCESIHFDTLCLILFK